jgi:molecular chaperone Hsp33
MEALLKGDETVTLRIQGDGPIGGIIAEGNARGEVRGYAKNPKVHVPLNPWGKLDVAQAVGSQGTLCVTYDLELKKPYTGCVPLVSGEIAKDLVYYFYTSEQIPSIVALGVLVGWEGVLAAGGLLVQLLPDAPRSAIPILEKNATQLSDVSHLIEKGKTPENLIEMALDGLGCRFLGKQTVHFKCRCSKTKLKNILLALGKEEIIDLMEKEGKVEAFCPFCGKKYLLQKQELEELLEILNSKE